MLNNKKLIGRLIADVYKTDKITGAQMKLPCIGLAVARFMSEVQGHDFPIEWAAYAMATAYHETAFTMKPIEEYGKGKGHSYGEIDHVTGERYYGRGYVQLTHKENYQRMSCGMIGENLFTGTINETGVDLVRDPELALVPWYAFQIMFKGMSQGMFTGRSFADCGRGQDFDAIKARGIINGTDRAVEIQVYFSKFMVAFRYATGDTLIRRVVHNGDVGADVRELQYMLGLNIDGVAGDKTEIAVRNFQKENRLHVDGVAGRDTWAKLEQREYGI